jgi:DNA-binding response OmpR family regulator
MEPTILLLGKNTSSLEVLKDELVKFDRKILIANSNELILSKIDSNTIDLAIVGAGLPEETIVSMTDLIANTNPNIEVHVMKKSPGMNPTSMIGYTNEKAVMWKLIKAMKSNK